MGGELGDVGDEFGAVGDEFGAVGDEFGGELVVVWHVRPLLQVKPTSHGLLSVRHGQPLVPAGQLPDGAGVLGPLSIGRNDTRHESERAEDTGGDDPYPGVLSKTIH